METQDQFADADRINIENDYEVRYWISQLKVTNDELKEAVMEVGNEMVELRFKRYDLAIKTDEQGRPVLLFMGEKDAGGKIKGERYARRLVADAEGKILKDHWDHKGKAFKSVI